MIHPDASSFVTEPALLHNFFKDLVNQFFKILPMRENKEASLPVYMQSLRAELLGCRGLVEALNNDASFMMLLSILQYLIDNPECPVWEVKREVFKSISICNKIKAQYAQPANQEEGL